MTEAIPFVGLSHASGNRVSGTRPFSRAFGLRHSTKRRVRSISLTTTCLQSESNILNRHSHRPKKKGQDGGGMGCASVPNVGFALDTANMASVCCRHKAFGGGQRLGVVQGSKLASSALSQASRLTYSFTDNNAKRRKWVATDAGHICSLWNMPDYALEDNNVPIIAKSRRASGDPALFITLTLFIEGALLRRNLACWVGGIDKVGMEQVNPIEVSKASEMGCKTLYRWWDRHEGSSGSRYL